MAENWSEQERRTNRLVRSIAAWLFKQEAVTADQIFGLIKLTWITSSHVNEGKYIETVKIPALAKIFKTDFSKVPISRVAREVASIVGDPKVVLLVMNETGITNIYNPYRNTSEAWTHSHFREVLALVKSAFDLKNDAQGRALANRIDRLPSIQKPNQKSGALHPANLLTPVMFALDKRIRFPILNGRKHVKQILLKQNVTKGTLGEKFDAMVSLYGKAGIRDAADLDQINDELENFFATRGKSSAKKLLRKKRERGKALPLKDERDLQIIKQEGSEKRKRIHNKLTNRLKYLWRGYTLTEGAGAAQYDVMVKNHDGDGSDLIVEVKSSAETANLRMAVGQLLSYSFRLDAKKDFDLCVLRPRSTYFDTVDCATVKPSFRSSPWIRGAAQSAFSSHIRRMRSRSSRSTFGRPPRLQDFQRHQARKPARCQPMTVSGRMIVMAPTMLGKRRCN